MIPDLRSTLKEMRTVQRLAIHDDRLTEALRVGRWADEVEAILTTHQEPPCIHLCAKCEHPAYVGLPCLHCGQADITGPTFKRGTALEDSQRPDVLGTPIEPFTRWAERLYYDASVSRIAEALATAYANGKASAEREHQERQETRSPDGDGQRCGTSLIQSTHARLPNEGGPDAPQGSAGVVTAPQGDGRLHDSARSKSAAGSEPAESHPSVPPSQTAPDPVAWIVSGNDVIPYPHIERLVDVGQFPSGTKLYAEQPPLRATPVPSAPQPTPQEKE